MNESNQAHWYEFRLRTLIILFITVTGILICAGWQWHHYMRPFSSEKQSQSTVIVGGLQDFDDVGVFEQFKDKSGIWIVHLPEDKLVAFRTICTHLSCTPEWLKDEGLFRCPCYGSEFDMTGDNLSGPAKRPLERFKINLVGNHLIVDRAVVFRGDLGQWSDPNAYVKLPSQYVKLGIPLDPAHTKILASGGTEITQYVGIKVASPDTARWYELADETCVCLTAQPSKGDGGYTVSSIKLGEKGKGYGDKISWSEQSTQTVKELDLSMHLRPPTAKD